MPNNISKDKAGNGATASITAAADFAYASAMLKSTPRSGYAFLGTGHESVAEHSWGTAVIGYMLARMAGADTARTVHLCLFHDLHEAATGDFNYVNHRYDVCDAKTALESICQGMKLIKDEILDFFSDFENRQSLEALLAHDADQLDFICSLRKQQAAGNEFATEWLKSAVERIRTDQGKELCAAIMQTSPHHWWYDQVDKSWWIERRKP